MLLILNLAILKDFQNSRIQIESVCLLMCLGKLIQILELQFVLYTYMCIGRWTAHVYVGVSAVVHTCVGQRSPSRHYLPYFLRWSLPLTWDFPHKLRWLGSHSIHHPCPFFLALGLQAYITMPIFFMSVLGVGLR